jgi:low temperature requirement protein LtrA
MTTGETPASGERFLTSFRRWFWRPPRAHGEIEEERTVSFLELFYDLVYVVVIAQAAHHLAAHISLEGFLQFAVIFGLVWIAWNQGSLYHDLHGRRDGRTRSFVFLQMGILVLLAVFTGSAAGETGTQFAVVYAAFLAVMAWLWYSVRRQDSEEYSSVTGRFLAGMLILIAAMLGSAFVPDDIRVVVWAIVVVAWLSSTLLLAYEPTVRAGLERSLIPTDSMVERFGLFTIIVLGEVVVGVVDGWSEAHDLDALTLVTGFLALVIGFGFWWLYFDFVGRRLPRAGAPDVTRWQVSNLPVTLAIAAAGAGMVSLIEHAHDPVTPPDTAWLLASAVAVGMLGLVVTLQTLTVFRERPDIFRRLAVVLLIGAVAALAAGAWQPAPWLLALSLGTILSVVWLYAVIRWVKSEGGNPSAMMPN